MKSKKRKSRLIMNKVTQFKQIYLMIATVLALSSLVDSFSFRTTEYVKDRELKPNSFII